MGLHQQTEMALDTEDGSPLPWALIRDSLRQLAPAPFPMIDFLLNDLQDRSPTLTEREQVHELMVVILSGLNPDFPRFREQQRPRAN